MLYIVLFQVAKLFHDASIGNTINIIVTRLVLLTEEQVSNQLLHIEQFVFIHLLAGRPGVAQVM